MLYFFDVQYTTSLHHFYCQDANTALTICAIIRPRRSRSAAAYSHQTFPWTICRSVHASDLDVVWQHRSNGSRDEAGSGVWDRSTGRGTFGCGG